MHVFKMFYKNLKNMFLMFFYLQINVSNICGFRGTSAISISARQS